MEKADFETFWRVFTVFRTSLPLVIWLIVRCLMDKTLLYKRSEIVRRNGMECKCVPCLLGPARRLVVLESLSADWTPF